MESILERLKSKRKEIIVTKETKEIKRIEKVKETKDREEVKKVENAMNFDPERAIFFKIEDKDGRKIYHTKIMNDLYTFGIHKRQKNKFFLAFRELFNKKKMRTFNLFPLKEDNKFLGIHYGYRKPLQNVVTKYRDKAEGVIKAYTFSKVCYIEFKLKNGSIYCYMRGMSRLLKIEKIGTEYNELLIERIESLEKQVYEYYGKQLPEGGMITKWIKKNQK
ncbi:putative cytosolic protein [Borrelia duttonii CR2A]|uniref:Putative cytosolic protein n=1 Tax=Borrelia duttonii CR2A TaxID=1432657 RepID=W6TGP9_9SPIR|nr:DUF226 domain-containing protein [Borrelia duttonii]ETZ17558.1 putative cytosolic protein [Borrelia duttonii CR2A]